MSKHYNSKTFIVTGLLLLSLLLAGCSRTYWVDRKNDLLDVAEIDFTYTPQWTPQFALYADLFLLSPIGFSTTDGKALGIGGRDIGVLDQMDERWGLLVWGDKRNGFGQFNPCDLHQARSDQEYGQDFPHFTTGIVGMAADWENRPPILNAACDKALHLGWIGVYKNCRPFELIDFIVGFTTVDLFQDDFSTIAEKKSCEIAPCETAPCSVAPCEKDKGDEGDCPAEKPCGARQ